MHKLDSIKRWFFVGASPPPFGGVTIFAKRLIGLWRKQGKFVLQMDLLHASKTQKILYLLKLVFAPANNGIYINDLSGIGLVGATFNLRNASIFFHDHNYDLSKLNGFQALALKHCLSKCATVFFDGLHSRHNYISRGYLRESTVYQFSSPFLPQDLSEKNDIISKYPSELNKFITNHSPLLSANAFRIILTDAGIDLYGLDMCISLLAATRERAPNAGFVFALSDSTPSEYLRLMQKKLASMGLDEHFFFFTGTGEVWPLFQLSDIMVRPTSTDGYGISIAEAIYAGTPAVASDVCDRPAGTITFKSRDQDDLNKKIFNALKLDS
ncbi:glycosyltransferase [Hydrogenophaga sp. Root209]|uniref:glycosyltransferase n=1 Tax=Hydrogenophaga sp. Root209 TaxID=1736490 RepID=UPI0009E8B94C|nr:glycosyltransferase [Hydrogenophaga sp. Root209]